MPSVPHLRSRRTALAGAVTALSLLVGVAGAQAWDLGVDRPGDPPLVGLTDLGPKDADPGTFPGQTVKGWSLSGLLQRFATDGYALVRISGDGASAISRLTPKQVQDLNPVLWADGDRLHFGRKPTGTDKHAKTITTSGTMTLDALHNVPVSFTPDPLQNLKAGHPVTFIASVEAPDGQTPHFSWNFGDTDFRNGRTVRYTFHTGGKRGVVLTVNTDDASFNATSSNRYVVTAKKEPKPKPKPKPSSSGETGDTTAGGAGGTGSGGTGGYGYGYGSTAGTATAATAGTSATATTATTAATTPTPAPTPTAVPVAAAGTGAAAPRPPLAVTTSDPIVRGALLSGPLGAGAVPTPAPLPGRAAQAAQQSRSDTDSPFSLPNVVWELALIVLLVGGGWWLERQNASSSRTVHHLR